MSQRAAGTLALPWPTTSPRTAKKRVFEQGHVIPPTAPGLGVELDEDVARAHPYAGDMLHLEMTQHPVR